MGMKGKRRGNKGKPKKPADLPLWKKLLFSALAVALFFGALELALAAAGVEPLAYDEDPYVGFSSVVPHFVGRSLPDGTEILADLSDPDEAQRLLSAHLRRGGLLLDGVVCFDDEALELERRFLVDELNEEHKKVIEVLN